MLSSQEREKLRDQLNHIPRSFTAQQRQNFQRVIKKKLKEDNYATRFPRFTPTNYKIVFVNRTTSVETLNTLINLVDRSKLFTLDTEATNIPHQPNKPSLIQLQILQPGDNSTIIFIEVCHLPQPGQDTFILIQKLFRVLLQREQIIFTWGTLEELQPFTQYDLFTHNQINLPKPVNVQTFFRTYWSTNYPHQPTESSNDTSGCKCLYCFGITHDGLISIQDAVAIALKQWIDKRLTRHSFEIGLDPKLKQLNDKQLEYRQCMANYAANDCDAVKQLIIYTNLINEQQRPTAQASLLIDDISPIDSPTNIFEDILQEEQPSTNKIREQALELDLEPISDDDDINVSSTTNSNRNVTTHQALELDLEPISDDDDITVSSTTNTNRNVIIHQAHEQQQYQLSIAERRRIHNRSCTLRQRRRLYKYKIICYIDHRFSIRKIKQLLDDNNISFTAINPVRLKSINKTILYIGVENPTFIRQHREIIKHLFSTNNYNKIYHYNY